MIRRPFPPCNAWLPPHCVLGTPGVHCSYTKRKSAVGRYVTYLRLSRDSKNGRNYGLDAQRRDLDLF